jgi:tetratricopeptide (TPR) repeat protein
MDYHQVVLLARQAFQRFRESARSELIKKNVANLTLDLSRLRNLMANSYLNLYRM